MLLAETPASRLLVRVQRQIAAFERTWHRANNELRRARAEADPAPEACVCDAPNTADLASFPQSTNTALPDAPEWPPTDKTTGRPLYFVG